MRIDHKGINPATVSLESTERTEADKRTGKGSSTRGSQGDSLQLSSEAQLLHSALKAAGDAPATRADKVEAARQKLAAGELGKDAGTLADRLIDDLLER
ncbi:MAG: flagellar biosynthesis anti-sigma factor FlgM [Vicinamibacterales bacterium]